jgi:hypothetical protein
LLVALFFVWFVRLFDDENKRTAETRECVLGRGFERRLFDKSNEKREEEKTKRVVQNMGMPS